jgi:hypothetical protein
MPRAIDDQIADVLGGGQVGLVMKCASRAAQHRLDSGHKLAWAKRFGEVVVGANGEADDLVYLFRTRREHKDVGIGELAEPAAYLDAVHPREHEVQHDEVRALGADEVKGSQSIGGNEDSEPLVLEVTAHQFDEVRLVIDHEHTRDDIQQGGQWGRVCEGLIPP